MNALQSKWTWLSCAAWLAFGFSAQSCAGTSKSPEHAENESVEEPIASGPVHIALPRESTAVRDDRKAPILQVSTTGNVVFPTVYGYPIYPDGDASQGILMLRRDNW